MGLQKVSIYFNLMKPQEGEPVIWKIDDLDLEIKYPEKQYWPEDHISKLDLLNYYREISKTILPYFKDRPVTLHYFPRGIHKISFYKRNFEQKTEGPIQTAVYHEISQQKDIQVPVINSEKGLLWLANKGCIEFHLWNSKINHLQNPDWIIFDLDINKNTAFDKVLQAALIVKEELDKNNLRSSPKTSGGTGLHLYVPVYPEYSFDTIRNWLKVLVERLSKKYPDLISPVGRDRKTHQGNKVIIDIMQNVISRNTAAPYTVRAHPKAPVSTPLKWQEIERGGFTPTDFNLKNIPDRIKKYGDVFSGILTNPQELAL